MGSSTGASRRVRRRARLTRGPDQREQPPGELLAHAPPVVVILDLKIGFEQVDHRQIRGGLAIGSRAALQRNQPCVRDAWVNSWKRRVFPIPGSPMTATTWPCPASACSRLRAGP